MFPITRRKLISGAVGAAGACLASAGGIEYLEKRNARRPPPFVHRGAAFGTTICVTALHADEAVAQKAAADAFEEILLVERLMSIYREDSQLSRLNQRKLLRHPHSYVTAVVTAACEMARQSDGAFDPTVQPLWELHAQAKQLGRAPTERELAAARSTVDWRRIEVSPRQIRLLGGDTTVTLNGIAQGFATDRALDALARHGAAGLVNAGEIGGRRERGDDAPWKVGIQHPRVAEAFAAIVPLDGRRLATSGDYFTTFESDYRRNHIFDPRTGESPCELASVSVLAPTAMQADALSTAVFVLGPSRGAALIRSLVDVDGYFILKDGRAMASDKFPLERS